MTRIARYTENNFSLLRSKIRDLAAVHRASLEALLRHLLLVASHSDRNAMTVSALAAQFSSALLRGNESIEEDVHAKARCNDLLRLFSTHSLRESVY